MYSVGLFAILFVAINSQESVDNPCIVDNKKGVCKVFSDCPGVRENLKKHHIWPKICKFRGKREPIVCCPLREAPGDISRQKCRENSQYIYKKRISPATLINKPVIIENACGHKVGPLIVGGKLASRREFPHMAAIGFDKPPGKWYCGGTILSENYILTAAHCLNDPKHGNAKYVRVGVTDLTDGDHSQTVEVNELIPHPNYSYPVYNNDIGLIKVKDPITLNPYARPACLNTKSTIHAKKAIATGFGTNATNSQTTMNNLFKVTLDFLNNIECDDVYKDLRSRKIKGIFDDMHVCAYDGGPYVNNSIKDTCQGDSGGPLQIYHVGDDIKCMYDIVGVTSFGSYCDGTPGVYVRVSNYIKWIEEIVWSWS